MIDAKVKELMEVEYDYGHFEEEEAREIVEEAIAKCERNPMWYDDLDDAIDMIAHARMYPED